MANKHKDGCWKCGTDRYAHVKDWQLFGYNCELCHDCANDGQVFIRDHPSAIAKDEAEVRQHAILAQMHHDSDERFTALLQATADCRKASRELFNLAQSWVAGEYEL